MAFVTSQAIQWLRLHTSTAGAVDSIPGHGIKIPHATDCDKKKKKSMGLLPSLVDMCRVMENMNFWTCIFPADVAQSHALLFCFNSHIINCPFHSLFCAMFSSFYAFLLMTSLFKMTPKC